MLQARRLSCTSCSINQSCKYDLGKIQIEATQEEVTTEKVKNRVSVYNQIYSSDSEVQDLKDIAVGDFLVVKVFGKQAFRLYLVQVVSEEDAEGLLGRPFKRLSGSKTKFTGTKKEVFYFPREDVVEKLPQPTKSNSLSKRFKDCFEFSSLQFKDYTFFN